MGAAAVALGAGAGAGVGTLGGGGAGAGARTHTGTSAAATGATIAPPSHGLCYVCGRDVSGLSILEAQVHFNECLDRQDADWTTQRAFTQTGDRLPRPGGRDTSPPPRLPDDASEAPSDGDPDPDPAVVDVADAQPTQPSAPLDRAHSVPRAPSGDSRPHARRQTSLNRHVTVNPLAVLMNNARRQSSGAGGAARSGGATRGGKAQRQGKGGYSMFAKRDVPAGYVPFYKKLPGTPIAVDAFQYQSSPAQRYVWLLTHFHADHYGGLTKHFNDGVIYCTPVTAALVHMQIGVKNRHLRPIPLNTPTVVHDVEVTAMDANHCPGAAIWLFRLTTGKVYLHVGDFRWCASMALYPPLRAVAAGADAPRRVDVLYLDTTYCGPQYRFPKQATAIQAVQELVAAHAVDPGVLFLFGSYSIGKEKVFMEVARKLDEPVAVSKVKHKLISTFGWPFELMKLVTVDPSTSRLHVVPMGALSLKNLTARVKKMKAATGWVPVAGGAQRVSRTQSLDGFWPGSRHAAPRFGPFTSVVAFKPTGWTVAPPPQSGTPGWRETRAAREMVPTAAGISLPCSRRPNVVVYGVPYSEHSSFDELRECVEFLDPVKIVPTVNCRSRADSERLNRLLRLPDE